MKRIFLLMSHNRLAESTYIMIREAVAEAGAKIGEELMVVREDNMAQSTSITEHIFRAISDADLVIADLSRSNLNVIYELGVAHGREKPTILIREEEQHMFFDVFHFYTLLYDRSRLDKSFKPKLVHEIVDAILNPQNLAHPFVVRNELAKRKPTVFISYSHADKEWLARLHIHLRPLEKDNQIELWDDTRIKSGAKWKENIEKALDRAAIAVLLISADYLASDFVVDNELPPLLRSAEEKGTTILPLILKPCRFIRDRHLSVFQAINDPREPLLGQPAFAQEEMYARVADIIENELRKP